MTADSHLHDLLFDIRSASFTVNGRTLLHPLDLALAPGRVYGLVGHNGSGKSTLLKLLARQQPQSAGEISFNGRGLSNWSDREYAREVAYLPQNLPATGSLNVRDLVSMGRYPWHGALGRFRLNDRRKVDAALLATGVAAFAERRVSTLSGGERQRVWLALLVAQDTQCMLLDEPISALDIAYQIEVLSLVRKLSHEHEIGVVVVLHDINMAARYCDEMIALREGRMIARGAPPALVTPATLADIYGIPMEVLRHPVDGTPVCVAR